MAVGIQQYAFLELTDDSKSKMKSRVILSKLSLALLMQMQTSASVAFQSTPSVILSSKMCHHRMSTRFMDANKIVSPVIQQQQQLQDMLLRSNQSAVGRKEINNNKMAVLDQDLQIPAALAKIFLALAPDPRILRFKKFSSKRSR